MLLEFSCTNFKSIKDKIVLSMIASSDDENEDLLYEIINTKVKTKVLNSAVIYGANGSGKTNLIQAIVFMRNLVVESIYNLPGYLINQLPHKLKSINDDSIFNMQFITKGKRYAYGFVLNNCKIKEEYLYVFPNGRQLKIFERINNEILSGDKYKGKFELCKSALQENKLLLTCAAAFTSIDEIKDVFTFFSEDLVIYTGNPSIGNWLSHSLDLIHQDKKIKENVLHLLQQLDTGIKDINIELDDITQKYSDSVMMLSDVVPNNVVNNKNKYLKTSVVYDQFEIDLLNEESMGIKK